jgi:proteasome activator subunit 4
LLTLLLVVSPTVEDDALQVDSPEQEPVDDDFDDEDIEELHLPGTPSPAFERADPFDGLYGAGGSPKKSPLRKKLQRPKEKPRSQQLDYVNSLPYEAETLEEMDEKLEFIVRRLVDCIRAKD